ncbi:MAG: hypothetical protein FJ138_02365 [Deltaproteobacteria bacterium]|nr:hypothetical protein [Deltaproteobacteria bacterium]
MQDHGSRTPFTWPRVSESLSCLASFTLMGALSGAVAGFIDAMSAGGVSVLLGAMGLHALSGAALGALIGFLYGFVPRELSVTPFLRRLQGALAPPPQASYFRRGRVIALIWSWALLAALFFPPMSRATLALTEGVQTPLWGSLLSAFCVTLAVSLAGLSSLALSAMGGRALEMWMSQLLRLTSGFTASLPPLLTVGSIIGLFYGLIVVSRALLQLIKDLHDQRAVLAALVGLAALIVGACWGVARALLSAQFKSTVAALLKVLRMSKALMSPTFHLALALALLAWRLVAWMGAQGPEWAELSVRPVVICSVFLIPLFLGGEYLKPFVLYSPRLGTAGLLAALLGGAWGAAALGLQDSEARDTLARDTASSAGLLAALRDALDRDRDGFADGLGQRDCDERNPLIFPGAKEVAGNGVDEDCDGLDLPLERLRAVPVAQAAPAPAAAPPVEAARSLSGRLKGPYHLVLVTLPGLTVTPSSRLGGLAARGLLLESVYGVSSESPVSLLSLLSGRYPSELVRDEGRPTSFSAAMTLLPEVLKRAQYRTGAWVADGDVRGARGFEQGFDVWRELPEAGRARKGAGLRGAVEEALAHLAALRMAPRERAFTWLHSAELLRARQRAPRGPKGEQSTLKAREQVEQDLALLVEGLSARDDWAQTAVVVVGTQGVEAEGARGLSARALATGGVVYSLQAAARREARPVSALAITATLLDLAEVESFDPHRERMRARVDGLAAAHLGDPLPSAPVYAEELEQRMNLGRRALISEDGWALLLDAKGRVERLSRVGEEGGGSLHEREPGRAASLRGQLGAVPVVSVRAMNKLNR